MSTTTDTTIADRVAAAAVALAAEAAQMGVASIAAMGEIIDENEAIDAAMIGAGLDPHTDHLALIADVIAAADVSLDEDRTAAAEAPVCTGERYPINPDAPAEGTDVYHDAPCPAHTDLAYEARCARAARDQGLDPVTAALTEAGIAHRVAQTGGWVMCVEVPTSDGGHIAIVEDPSGGDGYWVGYTSPAAARGDAEDEELASGATLAEAVTIAQTRDYDAPAEDDAAVDAFLASL